MKKILLYTTVLFVLGSCSKRKDILYDERPPVSHSKQPERCDFGLTQFNMIKRPPTDPASQKPKNQTSSPTPPPAGAVILLDFDGAIVAGTGWNYNGEIICAPANLSSEEMSTVFNRVANDYSPFNVTVTTNDSVYNTANPWKRTRVIITETYEWFGSAGGTAYVGSFTWGNNTPCFVFSSLLNYNVKSISEAVSHEAGHTIGLYHQSVFDAGCTMISQYNYGQGTGENGWAPIMGVGYYQNLTLWYNGPNSYGCTSNQNETAIISSVVGGFKTDDHSNTLTGAATLTSTLDGLINSPADIDFFYLNTNSQNTVSALPYSVGPGNAGANVNLVLKIYNSSGSLIATIDDTGTLGATILLGPGQYYLSVSTTGNQNASVYGMLGMYSIAVTAP